MMKPLNAVVAPPPPTEEEARRKFADDMMIKLTGKPFDAAVAGYKIALYLPKGDDKIGSIYTPASYQDKEVLKANCGFVIGVGPEAYSDPQRYPKGPWCRVGDWVAFQRYETTAAIMGYRGIHIAVIPDDKIDMVVPDRMDVTEVLKRDLL